jgi:hypothetical protein
MDARHISSQVFTKKIRQWAARQIFLYLPGNLVRKESGRLVPALSKDAVRIAVIKGS